MIRLFNFEFNDKTEGPEGH